ncbi:MAG: hypothetical protein QGH15_09710, partial [Kiritimatiellia bacterium]|nr:hypothetical protein [Kiritimatiellia bacterium]
MRIRTGERNHPRSRAGVPEDHAYGVASTEVRRQEETQLMESALNSTIVLLGQYVCSISHNVYET